MIQERRTGDMDFEEAARRVHLSRSIAFFGAGFSRDAVNVDNKHVASADELAEALSRAAGETETLPLSLAAQQYVSAKVAPDIRTFLQQTYSVREIQPYQ